MPLIQASQVVGGAGDLVSTAGKTADQPGLGAGSWAVISEVSNTITVATDATQYLLFYRITGSINNNGTVWLAYRVDSGAWTGMHGQSYQTNYTNTFSGMVLLTLAAGSRTIDLGWYHNVGTGSVYEGNAAGGSGKGPTSATLVRLTGA